MKREWRPSEGSLQDTEGQLDLKVLDQPQVADPQFLRKQPTNMARIAVWQTGLGGLRWFEDALQTSIRESVHGLRSPVCSSRAIPAWSAPSCSGCCLWDDDVGRAVHLLPRAKAQNGGSIMCQEG